MAEHNGSGTYSEYMDGLWDQMERQPEPRALSRLVAAEACFLQVPDAEAATARPDGAQIDGWAEIIEGTKAFERLWDSPATDDRIADRNAEGLMTDFYSELVSHIRTPPREREPERAAEKQREIRKTAPEDPAR